MSVVPETFLELLEQPIIGALGTVRPDGTPQVNPMWFSWDGELLRFSHTRGRQKFRNVESNPAVSLLLVDPARSSRYVEVRGVLERVDDDSGLTFWRRLQQRYGYPSDQPPPDAAERVVLVVRPTKAIAQ